MTTRQPQSVNGSWP